MSRFQELQQELEECMCTDCWGTGTQDDAEPGGIGYIVLECPTCKGTGINPAFEISLDIEGA